MTTKSIKIGCYQNECKTLERYTSEFVNENITILEGVIRRFTEDGVDIVVFPELFLCGYAVGTETIQRLAEYANGPSFQRISEIARKYGVYIIYGYAERVDDSNQTFNTAMIINSSGEGIGNYRKVHLWGEFEHDTFIPGSQLGARFELNGIQVGVLICWDLEMPEPARVMALEGVELLLVPTANTDTFANNITVRSRAFENHLCIAYVNRSGQEGSVLFNGESCIVGPDGNDMARLLPNNNNNNSNSSNNNNNASLLGGQTLIATFRPEAEEYRDIRQRNPFLSPNHRRVAMYSSLHK